METNINSTGFDGDRHSIDPEITKDIIRILTGKGPIYHDKEGRIYDAESAQKAGIPIETLHSIESSRVPPELL